MQFSHYYTYVCCFLLCSCYSTNASDDLPFRSNNEGIKEMVEAGWEFRSKISEEKPEIYFAKNRFGTPSKNDIAVLKQMGTIQHLSIIASDSIMPLVLEIPTVHHLELHSPKKELSLSFLDAPKALCELETLRITGSIGSTNPISLTSAHKVVSRLKTLSVEQCEMSSQDLQILMAIPSLESLQVDARFDNVDSEDYFVSKKFEVSAPVFCRVCNTRRDKIIREHIFGIKY